MSVFLARTAEKQGIMTLAPIPVQVPSARWLERANRLCLLSRVLGGTVHEVNNALQVISGNAELVQMAAGATEAIRTRGQVIDSQAKRASALLSGLAEFARDARDRAERVSLGATLDRALQLRRHALAKLCLTPDREGPDVSVAANPRHLLQIVLNLMVNAERALAGAEPRRLGFECRAEGDRALLVVEDSGAGVAPSDVPALFAPRLDQAAAGSDLGIGLWVSRELAAQNGGELVYAPAPQGGSRFTLTLPASRG